jgi:hypothetical protein
MSTSRSALARHGMSPKREPTPGVPKHERDSQTSYRPAAKRSDLVSDDQKVEGLDVPSGDVPRQHDEVANVGHLRRPRKVALQSHPIGVPGADGSFDVPARGGVRKRVSHRPHRLVFVVKPDVPHL